VLVGSALWIASGWTDGSSIPMMAAVACSFFATFDNPVQPIALFRKYALGAVALLVVDATAILPPANSFEMVALLLAPMLLLLHDQPAPRQTATMSFFVDLDNHCGGNRKSQEEEASPNCTGSSDGSVVCQAGIDGAGSLSVT
jgi:hypothetical protein